MAKKRPFKVGDLVRLAESAYQECYLPEVLRTKRITTCQIEHIYHTYVGLSFDNMKNWNFKKKYLVLANKPTFVLMSKRVQIPTKEEKT